MLEDPVEISENIYVYYKKLFGKQVERKIHLDEEVWAEETKLNMDDNIMLTSPFTELEVQKVISDMKLNSAPGPDGFSSAFYKACWGVIRQDFMNLIEDFNKGNLDIARLNYGAITLIPKVQDAFNVKQFRPICLLNVSFKILTNLWLNRLAAVVDKLIDKGQTAFIKGRYILDGVVILHETLHELIVNKKGSFSRLILRRPMIV